MVLALALLAAILALLSTQVQAVAGRWFRTRTSVAIAACVLACLFCLQAAWSGVLNAKLFCLVFAYMLCPTLCVVARGADGPAGLYDLAAILLLWLPLEFGIGQSIVPRPIQGSLHAAAYGMAITLALILFLLYRRLSGMRYNLPRRSLDFGLAAAGFVCAAAVLIPLGLTVGFMGPAHASDAGPGRLLLRVLFIFAATALPEEILFRSLIQNWLVQRSGSPYGGVLIAALIFGLSHLNNGPAAGPNWPYAIVATIAGLIFGTVFLHSGTIVSSALVHTGVNTVKYLFF